MFNRQALIAAFEAIGAAALANGTRLELAVYDGAALMLASDVRFAPEDVDVAAIGLPWPDWLSAVVRDIAERNGWSGDWLGDAVTFHLSPLADRAADHAEFGSFPRSGAPGLDVLVPTAPYRLALKLKAMRVLDAAQGEREAADIRGLMRMLDVDAGGAMAILRHHFPNTAADGSEKRVLLRHIGSSDEGDGDAPRHGR